MPISYSDFVKPAKDLLSKPFGYTNKFEVKNQTSNGVAFTTEFTMAKEVSGLVKAEFASGNLKVNKLQLGTDKKVVGEFSLAKAFPNTKLSFKATDGTRASGADAITAVLGAEYSTPKVLVNVDVDPLNTGVDASAVAAFGSIQAGASVKAAAAKATGAFGVNDFGFAAAYKTAEYTVAVQTEKKVTGLTAALHHNVNATTAFGAMAKLPAAFKASAAGVDLEAGLTHKLAADTTVAAKINASGKLGLSYAQQVSALTKMTLAAELDAANIASEGHKFGAVFNITL